MIFIFEWGKSQMRKWQVTCIGLVCMVSLAGCSANIQEKVEKSIWNKSGILDDADYLDYQEKNQDGTLEDEFYADMMNPEKSHTQRERNGKVHVTFASNSNVQVEYYYDSLLSESVDISNCYLNPNDSLYASVVDYMSEYEELYTFSGYRIIEFDEQGKKLGELDWNTSDIGHVFQIPMDFKGSELAVVPIGKYENCIVNLSDYMTNDDAGITELGGTWCVNGKKVINTETTVSPVEVLSVTYEYDCESYFFVSSEPVCYSADEKNGEIHFYSSEKLGKETSYSVELYPYITTHISLGNKAKGYYVVEDSEGEYRDDKVEIDGEKEFDIKHLKFGDRIVVVTDKECDITTDCALVSETSVEKISDGYKYTLVVSSDHMPNFQLLFDESIGTNATFSVTTAEMTKGDLRYVDGFLKSENVAVNQIISLREGIQIGVENDLLGEQEAFKIEIKKTDKDNNVVWDTQYIVKDSASKSVEVLRDTVATNLNYKDIEVSISRIEAYRYKTKEINGGIITLKMVDNGQKILPGTIVDGDRKVLVTIRPNTGWYVDGDRHISGDSYVKEMTFSEYMRNIGDIVEENPIKNYIDVTLDVTDSYGVCTFTVDGNEESGTVKLKHHQKLVMKYKITNDDYQIQYDTSGLFGWANNFKNKKEIEVSIELSTELDGKTLTREGLDVFDVKKKGE